MNESDYKSIGDVAKILNLFNEKTGKLNTHTIRFWEKEFKHIKPKVLAGKRRYYDKKSIEFLKELKFLLKEKGFTIKGVKKYLNNKNSLLLDETSNNSINTRNKNIKDKLKKISKLIKNIKSIK
jgi:DNA-binding transcriptional MerR regulator|tara:strand:+ start:367 stop:738 length:372 start_codon:yes stop_codon:yes gene_type:complete